MATTHSRLRKQTKLHVVNKHVAKVLNKSLVHNTEGHHAAHTAKHTGTPSATAHLTAHHVSKSHKKA